MKKQIIAAAVTIIAAATLAGCGGGGSTTPTTATVAGKVADGYLENATVFMDKNNNYLLDEGEPKAITNDGGEYTLTVNSDDVGRYPIIALALAGTTTDMDNPTTKIAHSYLLSLPKESVTGTVSTDSGNFLSPLSTQLREMMVTGDYATMYDAMVDLREKLGVPADAEIMADYMSGQYQNAALHTAAQHIATLMGEQQNLMFRDPDSATGLDVNRYRYMMGAIFGSMSTVRTVAQMPSGMTSNISNITVGMPFQNMSSFRSGMTWGGSRMGR
uniref:Lipoprotein n=1 Tax=Geobacter sp. (strain M21) TaxID=443144 RepID=C6E922_GEOSM